MTHHHLKKPAPRAALTGCFISCAALLLATAPANAGPLAPAAGMEYSDIGPAGLTPSISGEAGSLSRTASDAGLPGTDVFEGGSGRSFVLDNPMAQSVPLSGGAAAPPAARSFQDFSTEAVEYTLLGDALEYAAPLAGFAGVGARTRDERDWRNADATLFASANIQNPPEEQNIAARSYGVYENSVVYGGNSQELSPLYYRPLTERLNLSVRSYVGYEDASLGNSDPVPYTGIGLTISREAWPK